MLLCMKIVVEVMTSFLWLTRHSLVLGESDLRCMSSFSLGDELPSQVSTRDFPSYTFQTVRAPPNVKSQKKLLLRFWLLKYVWLEIYVVSRFDNDISLLPSHFLDTVCNQFLFSLTGESSIL